MGLSLSEYISKMGTQKFCKAVNVSEKTAYDWKNKKSMPTPTAANDMINISHGLLTWESIYDPYFRTTPQHQQELPLNTTN